MPTNPASLTQRLAWEALEEHSSKMRDVYLRILFADDPRCGERFAAKAVGIYLDYSKNRITDEDDPAASGVGRVFWLA